MTRAGSDAPFVALVVMGVSASGKSTIGERLAKRLNWAFEDGDAFHSKHNVEKMHAGQPLTDEDRWPWLNAIAAEIDRRRARGEPVVIACSALKRAYRAVLTADHGDVRVVYLRGDADLIAARIAKRKGHFMPPELLASQFKTLEEPGRDEQPIVVDIGSPIDDVVDRIVADLERVG